MTFLRHAFYCHVGAVRCFEFQVNAVARAFALEPHLAVLGDGFHGRFYAISVNGATLTDILEHEIAEYRCCGDRQGASHSAHQLVSFADGVGG